MIPYKTDFNKIDWSSPIEGVRDKVFTQGDKQIRLVEYTKDMPLHWCENGHYGMIIEGEFEIEFENETVVYNKGDGVFIPNGKEHKHRAKVLSDLVKVIFVEDI